MNMDAELALQQAIHSRLTADASLDALLDGRIYDDVPAQAPFPYLASGEARSRDWSSGDSLGTELTLTDHALVSLRFRDGHIARQRDGITWRQELRFRALVEKP